MLSGDVRALIIATVELYSTVPLTQSIIDEGVLKLEEAKELLLGQEIPSEPTEPIEKITTPVTLEELEAKFPVEPEYPELQLREDYDLEVNLKSNLLTLNVAEGTKVKTKGYYAVNDGGQAVY